MSIARSNILGWKWRFTKGEAFNLPFTYSGFLPLLIESGSGNVLVELNQDILVIHRHYHFDGATLAPDFPRVIRASAVHDALLQIIEKHPNKISEELAHIAFREQMKLDGFILWPIYYWAVSRWPRNIYKLLTKD